MGVRRGLGALLCGLLLPLAGCGDGESSADPPTSPAPTTSSTPTPTPSGPVIPEAAQGTDEASAKAFVRFWFDTLDASSNSGDVTALKALSTDGCDPCTALIRAITDTYEAGGHIESGGWVTKRVLRMPRNDDMAFDVIARVGPQSIFTAEGELERRSKGSREHMSVWLRWQHSGWRLDRLVIYE